MRIAFLGTPEPAVPALRALLDDPDTDVAVVVTNPDRPSGRGMRLRPSPVKQAAVAAGVELWQPDRPREVRDDLARLGLDACAVVAYGALLPPDVLAVGGRGFVNLHFSLLPAWRGAAPVQAAIRAGDPTTGVTCFVLEAGMDTGPVLATSSVPVGPRDTAGTLLDRLAEVGAGVLRDALHGFASGRVVGVPQDHDRATYAPKVTPDDARIDWTASAEEVERAVRAYAPVPGAHTTLHGERLKVHAATVTVTGCVAGTDTGTGATAATRPAGLVTVGDAGAPVVACGTGSLRLDLVQPASKARMDGAAFARGHPAVVGATLGR